MENHPKQACPRRLARNAGRGNSGFAFLPVIIIAIIGIVLLAFVLHSCNKKSQDNGGQATQTSQTQTQTDQKDKDEAASSQSTQGDAATDASADDASKGTDAGATTDGATPADGTSDATAAVTDASPTEDSAAGDGASNADDSGATASPGSWSGSGQSYADANAAQRAIVEAARSTPSAPANFGAQWVEMVYANAGFGRFYGNSNDLYDAYCKSEDLSDLKVGTVIGVNTHPQTVAGSTWGHTGIYIGDDQVMDSVDGDVRTVNLQEWASYYGVEVPVRWGWLGNVDIA